MFQTELNTQTENSNILLKNKRINPNYLKTKIKHCQGYLNIENEKLVDVSLEFELYIFHFYKNTQPLKINFVSTKFQKINNPINFLKGYLTINNHIKVIEFEVSLNSLKKSNKIASAEIELFGIFKKNEFKKILQEYIPIDNNTIANEINLVANIAFTTNSDKNEEKDY